jgi:cytochrome c biogenesis protein CcdA/thiol-disulfide isomerase/thioredoxin
MLVLLGIAFLAGVITAVSPCVLPVLPIVLAGGASAHGRRPYAIVAGMLATFVVSILFASWLLDKLGLPQDFLRNVAIALLFVVALTLLVPQFGMIVERALAPFSRRRGGDLGGGFVLGAALGLAFVPCGGPILAYVSAQSASLSFGFKTVALAIAYALGAGVVLLGIALGGQRAAGMLRAEATRLRAALGVVIAAAAFALVFNLDTKLQTSLPNWTNFLQRHTENSAYARGKLYEHKARKAERVVEGLPDYGTAPDFHAGGEWFNSRPLTIASLRGKVVLVDFWTYSCINCLRTLPHLEAWDAAYRKDGLVIVGVHTPEFAFEHVASNVSAAVKRLGVKYPVVQDNDYATWNAYANQYWPAEYLIDKQGHVRHAHFGEGEYPDTERLIRRLLGVAGGTTTRIADTTPTELMTPETYLGSARIANYSGTPLRTGLETTYAFPATLPQHHISYAGSWTVERERALPGKDARLRLHFVAKKVFIVLGGRGDVQVLVDGKPHGTLHVNADRLYTVVDASRTQDALLELRFSPRVEAYSFTFG